MRPLSRTGAYFRIIEFEALRTARRAHRKRIRQRAEDARTEAARAGASGSSD